MFYAPLRGVGVSYAPGTPIYAQEKLLRLEEVFYFYGGVKPQYMFLLSSSEK